MKITFIGHASILVEMGSVTVLSDPWWRGPCFGAQWWNYPEPHLEALKDCRIDYIYISHGHHDHFHPGTLRTLSRDSKVIISRGTSLASPVRELGFEVVELGDEDVFEPGPEGVSIRVMGTYSDDTLMTITDGREVCLNLNDALHAAPEAVQADFVARLKKLFPRIEYVFCGYGVASHFPNCYVIPGKDREATAANRQRYFNRQWAKLMAELEPAFGFPFAADVVFLEEELFWANEPTHNTERPTDAFKSLNPESPVTTIDIAPGFAIQNGDVLRESFRKPVSEASLRTTLQDKIARANRYGRVSEMAVKEVAGLIQKNLEMCASYLHSYEGNYRFLIRFRNSQYGIWIEKQGRNVISVVIALDAAHMPEYDVSYTTRLPYLKWSLTEPFGDEILFVGSGGIFEYKDQLKAGENLHRELAELLRRRDGPPRPRYGKSSKVVHNAKQAIKQLIGRRDQDLYSLATWTVFKDDQVR